MTTTFWLIMIFVFAIGSAISLFMYNYHKDESGREKHKEVLGKQNQLGSKIDSTKKEIVDEVNKKNEENESLMSSKMDSTKETIIKKQAEAEKSIKDNMSKATNKIINKVDVSSTYQEKNQKEILGKLEEIKNPPKDPNGLYRDNKKWGSVKNFKLKEDGKNFIIDEIFIEFPIVNIDDIFLPTYYKNYTLKFQQVESLSQFPSRATKIEGIVLSNMSN